MHVDQYVSGVVPDTRTSEKEHVIVTLKISINGRSGVILLDPGYHVGRAVVVMHDEQYPHTGNFHVGNYSTLPLSHRIVHT